jgi:site-specific DNA-methyltransferase (cytosine-N4-specific)
MVIYSFRMSKLYTTDEAAKYLGVTASRVRQFIMEERLESDKYGRDHLIHGPVLEEFARTGKLKRGRPKKDSNYTLRKR